jgi:hypothetical protein
MADFLVKVVPIPKPRPSDLYEAEQPFFEEGLIKVGIERMKEQVSYYILEPLSQFYGWLEESTKQIDLNDLGISILVFLFFSGLVTLTILGIAKFINRIRK